MSARKGKIMEYGLNVNSSLSSVYFGKKAENKNPMKNGQLNFGVVTPPDNLPNASIYNSVYSSGNKSPKSQKLGSGNKITAGKFSAGCAISAMALAAFSLLPFVRKR